MLEILLIMLAVFAMAKRRPTGRRRFNLRRVRTTPALTLGTLADVTVLAEGLTGLSTDRYRAISFKGIWSIRNNTAQGPIVVGFSHSDYSVTEVKECLEASGAIAPGNKVAREQANRFVRIVGSFDSSSADQVLNDGKPITTKLNWDIPIGFQVDIFAYNESGASLTTGNVIQVDGNLWVKD